MSDVTDLHELWCRNRAAKKRRLAHGKDVATAHGKDVATAAAGAI